MAHIAQRRFGQNFLVDTNIVKKIIKQADIQADETVIEIGPGQGAITQLLSQQAKAVFAIELDRDLIQGLQALAGQHPNISIIHEDALQCYPAVVKAIGRHPYLVVANIPYNITSSLVRIILQTLPPASRAVLMVQKEVAMRMVAKPGDMSLLALSVQLYAHVKKCFDVAPGSFRPQPTVQSSVIQLTPLEHTKRIANNPESILSLAHYGFAKKRKLLASNIAEGLSLPKEKIIDAFINCTISSSARAQDLSVQQWTDLAAHLL